MAVTETKPTGWTIRATGVSGEAVSAAPFSNVGPIHVFKSHGAPPLEPNWESGGSACELMAFVWAADADEARNIGQAKLDALSVPSAKTAEEYPGHKWNR